MSVVSIDEFRGGLNNQKMILAGCFVLAKEKGAKVRLPHQVINFTPTTEGHKREPLLFSDVFDQDTFLKAIPSGLIANDEDKTTELLSWKACFEKGGQAIGRLDDLAIKVVVHLVANPELQKIADQIVEWLRAMNPFALQLRIERDWQEYLLSKFGSINFIDDDQEITVDVKRILAKCANTDDLSGRTAVWCCCDEEDLLVSKDAMKAQAALFGYQLYFKTDLPASISLPLERTKKSIVDFSVCMGLDVYVGLSRSTFSNQLLLMNQYGKCTENAEHYIYNNIGDSLLRRGVTKMAKNEAELINNNVLIGSESHLFLFDGGQRSFAFSAGDLKPSTQDIANFFGNIDHRYTFLRARGIPFLHLIFPSKEVVLKDKLTEPWRERIQSLFLRHYFASQPGFANLSLYPLENLLQLNRTRPVFRVLDSHMTDAGTMAVTQQVLEQWGYQYDITKFFIPSQERKAADLADMLSLKEKVSEEYLKPNFSFLTFDNRSALPGNTDNVCIIHNPGSLTPKRLLIFGDSFVKYALPFFAPIFRDVVYVRSATFQPDIVDLMAPDFVISSNTERYLCKVEADADSKPVIFKQYGNINYAPPTAFIDAYGAQLSYHHHRAAYEAWTCKMLARSLSWDILGSCQPNQQVVVLDLAGNFRSTGPDPFLVFPSATISPDNRYMLEMELTSDVESITTIYFQVEGDDRFSENRTIRLPVNAGNNHLRFPLPDVRLKSILRIDPLSCEGRFSIKNLVMNVVG